MASRPLKKEFGERAKRPDHLERLLTSLEHRDIENLPLNERSKLVQHLSRTIFREAAEGKFFYLDKETGISRVHEPPFEREVTQIVRLLESFKLSDYTARWARERAEELAPALRKEFPVSQMEKKWPALSLEEKKSILERVGELQCGIFKKGAISFLPSRIIFETRTGIQGFIEPRPMDLRTLTIPPLNINKAMVERQDFLKSALTVVHEQLHAIFMQLAIAAHRGMMPQSHPMAQDADKFMARVEYYGFGIGAIKSAYDADPEEKVAHSAHKAFADKYSRKQESWWQRLYPF